MSEQRPTVGEALAAVMDEVKAVAKKDRNESQRFNFRGIDAVVNAVGPALRKHGVVVLPNVLDHRYETVTSSRGTLMGHVVVTVRYDFVGPAGDVLSCTVVGESMDVGDKATPKAMSVAFRIALLQSLTLPTDEPDPDSESYERGQPARQPAPAKESGADDERASGLVDEFAAVESEEDLQKVSDTVTALDFGDSARSLLREAYRQAHNRVKAPQGS